MKKEDFFARTMHTPDDPARAELRDALRSLSKALIPLHRALIEAARADYTAMFAPISGPHHLLRLINDDPFFAWLKPMTSLIVDIDEMARTDFAPEDAKAIAARVEQLFGTSADAAFTERYLPVLQRDIDVAAGHAAVRKQLARLAK